MSLRDKMFRSSVCAVLALLIVGCEKSGGSDYNASLVSRSLKVSPTSFNHDENGKAVTDYLEVESKEASWKFSDYADWISLAPQSGSTSAKVTMNIQENPTANKRTSIFSLKSTNNDYNYQSTITVTQGGLEPYLTIDKNELSFSGKASSEKISVYSNFNWSASSNQEWATPSRSDDGKTLTISVTDNPGETYRNAVISLKQENNTYATVSVQQFPAEITVSNSTLTFGNAASQTTFTITSETSWSSAVSESWIQLTPSEGGAGVTTVKVEVSPNGSVEQRTGFISIRTGNQERLQIEIIQKGNHLEAESQLYFTSRVETQKVQISSNLDWQVNSSPEWLKVTPTNGSGNGEISVTTTENVSAESRTGKIEISSPGLNLNCTINVTQAGKSLTPGSTYLQFTDKGGKEQFDLLSDGAWNSVASASWFNASPVSGSGDATITVTVEENMTETERSGSITYSFGEKQTDVIVYQQGKYFDVDAADFTFTSAGGSHSIEFGTNQKWTAVVDGNPSWLTLSATSGEGEAVINVVAKPNNTVQDRKATIIITPQTAQAIRISVVQKGRYLNVSSTSLSFYSKGGESERINVDTDGAFTISSSVGWLSVNKLADNIFTVIAQPNQTPDLRSGEIIVSMDGLEQGSYAISIPVTQVGEGGSFVLEGYPSDTDWGKYSDGSLTISISGFTIDQDWNSKSNSSFEVKITGYPELQDWNNAH